jgi:hypothetical protein
LGLIHITSLSGILFSSIVVVPWAFYSFSAYHQLMMLNLTLPFVAPWWKMELSLEEIEQNFRVLYIGGLACAPGCKA